MQVYGSWRAVVPQCDRLGFAETTNHAVSVALLSFFLSLMGVPQTLTCECRTVTYWCCLHYAGTPTTTSAVSCHMGPLGQTFSSNACKIAVLERCTHPGYTLATPELYLGSGTLTWHPHPRDSKGLQGPAIRVPVPGRPLVLQPSPDTVLSWVERITW